MDCGPQKIKTISAWEARKQHHCDQSQEFSDMMLSAVFQIEGHNSLGHKINLVEYDPHLENGLEWNEI